MAFEGKTVKNRGARIVLLVTAALILGAFFALGEWHIRANSVTVDEFYHVPTGYYYLITGRTDLDRRGNPPMLRRWLALPLLGEKPSRGFLKYKEDLQRQWFFMIQNTRAYTRYVALARGQALLLGAVLGALMFAVALWRYGPAGGLTALALFCLSPNVIAHSALAGLDVGAALLMFLAMVSFYFLCVRPGVKSALACGLLTGAAFAAKYTGAMVVPMQCTCLVIAAIASARARRVHDSSIDTGDTGRDWANMATPRAVLPWYVLSLAVAVVVLNADYGFAGVFSPWGALAFKSRTLSIVAASAPWLRVPLPADYLLGLDWQMSALGRVHTFYLNGELSQNGWPHYFLVTYGVKETLPALLLVVVAVVSFIRRRPDAFEAFCLVAIVGLFGFYSFVSRVDLGVRYLLPALPFIYILIARLCAAQWGRARVAAGVALAALLFLHAAGTVRSTPYCLGYFNQAAGGPGGGYRYVAESNTDWGQGLLALRGYMERNNIPRMRVAAYGVVPPGLYGIPSDPLPCHPAPGPAAVSVNYLLGIDPFHGRPPDCYDWLRGRTPDARLAGGSMWVFLDDRNVR